MPYKPSKTEKFMSVAAPLAAIAEGIISKGTSQVAPQAYQQFLSSTERDRQRQIEEEERTRKFKREEEESSDRALRRKLQEMQITSLEEKSGREKDAFAKQAMLKKMLDEAKSDEERVKITEKYIMETDPKGYLKMKQDAGKPDFYEKLIANMNLWKAKEGIKEEKQIRKEERKLLEAEKTTAKQFETLILLGKKVPALGRIKGTLEKVKATVGANADIKAYEDFAQSFAGSLAKRFGNESGRLTNQDIDRMLKMTFKPTDTKAERKIREGVWKALVEAKSKEELQNIIYGVDIGEEESQTAPQTQERKQQLPTPQTQAEYDAIPSGQRFIDPDDGKEYIKP